jgi:RNA polymerase sigma factor (sigma-70 family)
MSMRIDHRGMSDEELLVGCLKKDGNSQKALFAKYGERMMGLCLRYAGSREEAQDYLQEGFIKVFEKLGQYNGSGALGGWISTVMVNTALIQLRKKKREGYSEDIDEMYHLSNSDHDILDQMSADELMQLVTAMPPGYRAVFNLFAIEGFSHKEIADKMEISESTSKTQFHKAKAYLKKRIEELNSLSGQQAP